MRVSELAPAVGRPHVQRFIKDVLDMQFADVRAMLQLPRPEIGIVPACNFAIVSSLCNLISGISTTIFKPLTLPCEPMATGYGSGRAFQDLVRAYFPYLPAPNDDFPKQLYNLCRNPLVHAVGLNDAVVPAVYFTRVFDTAHENVGWSDQELEDLERPDRPFNIPYPGIKVDPERWTLHCDAFYFDVIEMLRRLNSDQAQMEAAEHRFSQGVHNWRR